MTQAYRCSVHCEQANRTGFGRHFADARGGKQKSVASGSGACALNDA
jgi:hypothetical protein